MREIGREPEEARRGVRPQPHLCEGEGGRGGGKEGEKGVRRQEGRAEGKGSSGCSMFSRKFQPSPEVACLRTPLCSASGWKVAWVQHRKMAEHTGGPSLNYAPCRRRSQRSLSGPPQSYLVIRLMWKMCFLQPLKGPDLSSVQGPLPTASSSLTGLAPFFHFKMTACYDSKRGQALWSDPLSIPPPGPAATSRPAGPKPDSSTPEKPPSRDLLTKTDSQHSFLTLPCPPFSSRPLMCGQCSPIPLSPTALSPPLSWHHPSSGAPGLVSELLIALIV